jgi:hypothetical protein
MGLGGEGLRVLLAKWGPVQGADDPAAAQRIGVAFLATTATGCRSLSAMMCITRGPGNETGAHAKALSATGRRFCKTLIATCPVVLVICGVIGPARPNAISPPLAVPEVSTVTVVATSMSMSTHHDASVHVRSRADRGSPHVRVSATPCDAVTSSTVSSGEGIQWQHQGGSKSDTKSDLSQHYSLLHFLSRPRMRANGLPREPAADLDVYRGHRRTGIGTCL